MILYLLSVVEIVGCDLDHVLGLEVDLDEGLAAVLLLVLVHVVDLLNARLLYDLRAAETRVVGGVQPAAFGLADADLDDGGLLGVQAEALVQLLALVVVAPLAAQLVAGRDVLGRAVVAGRNDPVLEVDDDCPDRGLHAVGPSPCDVCDLHEVLVPGRPEVTDHVLLLPPDLLPQLLPAAVQQSHPHQLQTPLKLLVVELLIDAHKLVHCLQALLDLLFLEEVGEALFVVGVDQHHVQVVSFLELQQDVGAVLCGKQHGLWGLSVLLVAHLSDVLLGREVLGFFGEVHAEGGDLVLGREDFGDVLDAGEGKADEEDAQDFVVRAWLLLHDKKIGPELYSSQRTPKMSKG